MADWKSLLHRVLLADGQVDGEEVKLLSAEFLSDGQVDREEVDFLVGIRNGQSSQTAEFEKFFFEALSKHLLADGELDTAEATLIREILFADGTIDAAEKKFLDRLKSSAKKLSPEFDALYNECMKA
jgi:uncharacterized tellurite resistance protein B-like protein